MRDGFLAAMIHGDRSQSQRTGALSGFDEGRFKVLVATRGADLGQAGRGVEPDEHAIRLETKEIERPGGS